MARMSHSPQGECGLKFLLGRNVGNHQCHSPQGECGLKYDFARQIIVFGESLPARGVWIEIWATDTTGVAAMVDVLRCDGSKGC